MIGDNHGIMPTLDQVRAETLEFLRTHEWDVVEEVWVEKRSGIRRAPMR